MEYKLIHHQASRTTYVETDDKKKVIIGYVEQLRPRKFRYVRYLKPRPYEKLFGPKQNHPVSTSQHTYAGRNTAIWALKIEHENAQKETPE
ncbi:hypothetical protein H7H48_15760 [Nitratireductor sp. B36]|uniref:hypothetical protein n=1 Tax=Nitratireductor sp. B36 TaxID=2762059 RepID=UPI001E64C3C7|nr:hypothetical protein [Nitratireductor sp. B36]MCC5780517.1 hypothetical protein [Nitratireductor sp. B36]